MKIAVVGSGASAFGVISKIIDLNIKAEVSIFDNHTINNYKTLGHQNIYINQEKKETIKQLKKNKFSFIPPKCSFGLIPEKISNLLYESNLYGGLTTFWGGTSATFSSNDLKDWPLEFEDLEPYYSFLSNILPITRPSLVGTSENNFKYIETVGAPFMINNLKNIINNNKDTDKYHLSSSYPMLVNSYSNLQHFNCSYPGICSKNCKNHGAFKTYEYFNKLIGENNNFKYYNKAVKKISDKKTKLFFMDGDEYSFDKIYICSGAINTSKILINSFDIKEGLNIADNGLIQFPLFNFDSKNEVSGYDNFVSTNLIINSRNKKSLVENQWQVNQCFQYIFDYHFPVYLTSMRDIVAKYAQKRALIMRGYTDSTENNIYNINKSDSDKFILKTIDIPIKTNLFESGSILRNILSKNHFKSISSLNISNKTSGHYGSTTPYKEGFFNIPINSEVLKNIYICDSSTFNTMPSSSPTLTIMANAARVSDLSFNEN
jgi:hypothetical protein